MAMRWQVIKHRQGVMGNLAEYLDRKGRPVTAHHVRSGKVQQTICENGHRLLWDELDHDGEPPPVSCWICETECRAKKQAERVEVARVYCAAHAKETAHIMGAEGINWKTEPIAVAARIGAMTEA